MTSSRPPPPSTDPPAASRVLRFGSLVGLALASAFVASTPAALRLWDTSGSWSSLAALELLPILVAVFVFRHARIGVRVFAGPDASQRSLSLAVWLLLSVILFALFGAVLRATTHHHPLAGVTFSILACASALALIPTSRRIVAIALSWLRLGARARLAFAVLILGTIISLVVLRLLHALPAEAVLSPSASLSVVDLFAFALVAFLASNPAISAQKWLALVGPPAAVVLLAISVPRISSSTSLASAIVDRGPIFAPLVDLVARR